MPILRKEISLYPPDLLTEDPSQPDRRWWVIHTRSRREKALARQLLQQPIPFYLPLISQDRKISGRRFRSYFPLFTGYVFLYATEDERALVESLEMTANVLGVPDPLQLHHDLRQIQQLIEMDAPLSVERRLESGRPVRVKLGPLSGFEGVVLRRHGRERLLVAVNFLGQGVSVDIDDVALAPI